MTPERLDECLSIIRWSPDTLAECFGCDASLIEAWLSGEMEMPAKASAWIETVAAHMEAAETLKPTGLKGKRFER
jgi:hypothetical protein